MFRQNRNRHPVDIEIPVLPDLRQVIDASPTGDLTYLVTEFGRQFLCGRLRQQDARMVQ